MSVGLTGEELAAVLDETIKARLDAEHFRAKLGDITEKQTDLLNRARLQFELLAKVAVEVFGADPAGFDDLARLVLLGRTFKALSLDLQEFASAADDSATR